jgi:membrane fusion protein (multidrug efflux system)
MTPQMKRMLVITSIVLGLIFGVYAVKKGLFIYFMSSYEPPAVTISSAPVTKKTWQTYLSSVGTLTAVNGTDISAEIGGMVTEIRFQSGQNVKQGDVLVTLDSSIEQAQLKNDMAELNLAQINYDRSQTLLKKSVLSQSEFDTISAKLDEAKSSAEVTQARINQKNIKAPFAGKIGISLINLGQYVSAGTPMVTLQALDPLYVQFTLPEQYLPALSINEAVEIEVNINANGKRTLKGTVTAINSKVDQVTRNILIQATLPNQDLQLYPGMFANVTIWMQEQKNVITLPQTTISYSLHGDSVFIIKSEPGKKTKEPILHAYRQYVQVGERRTDEVAITDGLKEGDIVVSSGQLKLQNGTHVVIDNSVEL